MDTNKRSQRNIAIFIFAVLTCGWIGVWIDTLIPNQPTTSTIGAGIWLVTPLLVTFLLRGFAGDKWYDTGLKPNFRGNGKWYIIPLLIFPLVTAITLFIGKLLGWIDMSNFSIMSFIPIFAVMLLPEFIKNFFEESVWRGYLTSKVESLVRNEWWVYLIVGLVWGLWHLPYYLVFLEESYLSIFFPYGKYILSITSIFVILAWTVIFVELFLITRSIWSVVLLHTVEDSLINPIISEGFISITEGKELLVSPIVGLIPTTLYLLIGLYLRRQRKNLVQITRK